MLIPSLLMTPSLVGLALCLGVSWALWKRRPGPAWRYATITGLAVALWCLGQIGWLLTDDPAARKLITRIQYVGVAISPTMWLMTGLAYVGRRDWLRPGRIAALLTVPVLTIVAAATNDLHGLIWESFVVVKGRAEAEVYFGTWFYVHMLYSYVAGAVGSLIMAARFASSALYRRQLGVVLIGPGAVLMVNLVYLSSRASLPIDPTPASFAVAFAGVGWAMVRHHFFRFLPMARGLTVEGLQDGLIVLNAEGWVVDTNPAARILIGSGSLPVGATLASVLPSLDLSGVREEGPQELETASGARLEVRITAVKGNDGVPEGTVVLLRDVTAERRAQEELVRAQEDLRRANQELERLALTDTLTGLANRRRMEAHLGEEFARARRHGRPLSFVMMDIDHFKLVNDVHGHATGDRVLSSCGRAIEAQVRPGDEAARLGGDEFGVVLPETAPKEALEVAQRFRTVLLGLEHENGEGQSVPVTFSFGVSTLRDEDAGPANLMARADRALYRVKNSGRNGISVEEGR